MLQATLLLELEAEVLVAARRAQLMVLIVATRYVLQVQAGVLLQ